MLRLTRDPSHRQLVDRVAGEQLGSQLEQPPASLVDALA